MSVSTEVQRTLVKSPPELWSELSDPASLTRHLGELGEIRITKVEPETKVEWETEGASGIVQLKQSGWGTKVTLSVTRDGPAVEELTIEGSVAEPGPIAPAGPLPEPEVVPAPTSEPALEPEAIVEPEPEPAVEPGPEAAVEPEPEAVAESAPEPRRGFFARLFGRRKPKTAPGQALQAEPEPAIEQTEPPVAMAVPELDFVLPPEPERAEPEPSETAGISEELAGLEAEMAEQTTALLTGVLDRLGAAHHRPFSRG